jgi:hypothetical protein
LVRQRSGRIYLGGTSSSERKSPILVRHFSTIFCFFSRAFWERRGHRVRRMIRGQYEIWISTSLTRIESRVRAIWMNFKLAPRGPFSTYCLHCCALRGVSSFLQMGTFQANWLQLRCRMQVVCRPVVSNGALRGWRPEPLMYNTAPNRCAEHMRALRKPSRRECKTLGFASFFEP